MGVAVKRQNSNGVWTTTPYHVITNHRGDVVEIRDNNLAVVGSYEYDAYGNVLKETGDFAKKNPIRYASYYYDNETKNYYLKARYYNPDNGSFLALDPHPGDSDDPVSQNGYTYANNNPVMMVDPDGDVAWWIVGLFISGGIWNSYDIVWDWYKSGAKRSSFPWYSFSRAFIVGGIMETLGGSWIKATKLANIPKVIHAYNFLKVEVIKYFSNTASKGEKPTLQGLLWSIYTGSRGNMGKLYDILKTVGG